MNSWAVAASTMDKNCLEYAETQTLWRQQQFYVSGLLLYTFHNIVATSFKDKFPRMKSLPFVML